MGIVGDRAIWEAESRGIELLDLTIGELFDRRCEANADKEALVYNYPEIGLDLRLTYRHYQEEVNRLAKGLLALGIEKGEHVAVWATNLPEWVMLEVALAKIGAVLVTVNTNCRVTEIEYVLRQGDITTLFMIEAFRSNSYVESLYHISPELKNLADPVRERLQSAALPELKRVILIENYPRTGPHDGPRDAPRDGPHDGPHDGMMLYSQVASLGESIPDETVRQRQSSLDAHDVIQMQYTSGTTGFPKGVMLTHYGIINQAHVSCLIGSLRPNERHVTAMPFFHIAGSLGAVMFGVYLGCTLIPLIYFDAEKELELLDKEKATFSFNVPTMLVAMLNHPRFLAGEFDLSSLREIITGATPVPVVLMEDVRAKMGADCTIVFGLTESTGTVTETIQTDSFELKSSTVGIPHPHMDIKIADPMTAEPVGFGESGELMTRGFLVMKGYYNMPDRTAEAIDAEGWLHTGDLATMNACGYVNIVGRVKDMIIRGGENIYPAEIEAFLMRHPEIAEAQVVGLPDGFMGEEVAAVIRLKPGSVENDEEVRQYCRDGISRHKVPKYITFVTSLPLTASGKVKKFELREQLIEELGLKNVAERRTA
ncbi:MAG TPA: AMP-binding protein [Blastocatellia bacterium]|nr:AMP-binding protein [Blastocatellia bacterium]